MASAEVWPLDVGGGKGWLKALKAGTLNLRGEKGCLETGTLDVDLRGEKGCLETGTLGCPLAVGGVNGWLLKGMCCGTFGTACCTKHSIKKGTGIDAAGAVMASLDAMLSKTCGQKDAVSCNVSYVHVDVLDIPLLSCLCFCVLVHTMFNPMSEP